MKRIVKKGAPKMYVDWCKAIEGTENEDYRNLQNPEKEKLHETLLNEQGCLCGYTMRRIQKSTSHIEHIKPQTLCRDELTGSDLNYLNLLACFPKEGMVANYRYGAQFKGHWWDNNGKEFISPLSSQCENLITFNLKGEVKAYQDNPNAKQTIHILQLDNPILTDDRRQAIKEFIFGSSGANPISVHKAMQAINGITSKRNGEFVEFCIAIKYALIEYVQKLEKMAQKRKFAKQSQSKK